MGGLIVCEAALGLILFLACRYLILDMVHGKKPKTKLNIFWAFVYAIGCATCFGVIFMVVISKQ